MPSGKRGPKAPLGPKARNGGKILADTQTSPAKWSERKTKEAVIDAWEDGFIDLMKNLTDEKKFSWSNSNDKIKKDFEKILGMFQYKFQILIFIKKH